MYFNGSLALSSSNQDWGGFGSYLGGIIAPAASLLAAYMVYIGLSANAQQLKLTLARQAIARLDEQLERQLDQPLYNSCHGDQYVGQPLRSMVIQLSSHSIKANEQSEPMFLALLHNIAILTQSVRHYMELSREIPSTSNDIDWLGDLERGYWIDKYSAICQRMIKIVGTDALEKKITESQLESFRIVMMGESRR